MMSEQIIEKVLSKNPDISREEILERLEQERSKTHGLITDEALLRTIAAKLGVEISIDIEKPVLLIRDLVPGLNDVTVVGRVIAVFASRSFSAEGKVGSLLVADESSILRVVLWNDKTEYIESGRFEVGQIVRFSHGYTKKDYAGIVELHLGNRSGIEIHIKDGGEEDYPTIEKFLTTIEELRRSSRPKGQRVHLKGRVMDLSPVSTFERRDSSVGKVMRLALSDRTGEIQVVLWNEKIDELSDKLKKGSSLQLVNTKVKESLNNEPEVHVNSQTYVQIREADELCRIADLKESMKNVSVEGTVVTSPIMRKVETSRGELVKLTVFEVEDETGRIWVSAWRRHSDNVAGLRLGQKVILKDVYVKRGFGDQLELSTRETTSVVQPSK